MRLGKAICIAGLIGFTVAGMALADDVTFAASGTFTDGASLGGTLVIDTAAGVVQSNGLDLTVIGGDAGSPGWSSTHWTAAAYSTTEPITWHISMPPIPLTEGLTLSWKSISEALRV
jgi:hypothetical protein